MSSDDLTLSTQVLQEFYWQATRPTRSDRIPHELAVGLITAWSRFPVQEISLEIVQAALRICARHHLSYGDSAIIAAAQAMGCEQLLSEDMQHGQRVGSITIVNPLQ